MNEPCMNKQDNLKNCPCDWPGCERKGMCCECVVNVL